jgi:D-glycero-alpha-D-manno-heptose-7-phosphate kinase
MKPFDIGSDAITRGTRIAGLAAGATIRSRAPLRLGFGGGGTDLSPFCDLRGGAVLNCTIDRYAYCYLTARDDMKLVLDARDRGVVETHAFGAPIESSGGLRLHRGVYNRFLEDGFLSRSRGVTIVTTTDALAGSGLGTSSALVIAICEALREYTEAPFGLYELAHLAFEIERRQLRLAGGKQDQYSAAFGGVNFIEFLAQDRVIVNPLRVHRNILLELESSLVICFSGLSRESDTIIQAQISRLNSKDEDVIAAMISMKEAAFEMKAALLAGDLFTFGDMLNRSWRSKKITAATISNDRVEGLLQVGLAAGAYACKVSGAGGGGFLMFMTEPERKSAMMRALNAAGGEATPVRLTADGVEVWTRP